MERPRRTRFTGHPQIDADLAGKQERRYTAALEEYADYLEDKIKTLHKEIWSIVRSAPNREIRVPREIIAGNFGNRKCHFIRYFDDINQLVVYSASKEEEE